MSERPRSQPEASRLTIWVVPEGLDSPTRQLQTSTRAVRQVLVGVFAACLGVLGLAAVGVDSIVDRRARRALLDENLSLKSRILEIESRLDAADRELRRLRLYEAQLEGIGPDEVPGRGPMTDGQPAEDPEDLLLGLSPDQISLDDLGDEDFDEVGPPGMRLHELGARTDRLLEDLRLAELELGRTVETTQAWRDRRNAVPSGWPVDEAVLTSRFGWRRSPFTKRWKFHYGIDLSAPVGTIVRAPGHGVVITAEYHSGYGRMLEINHGFDVVTRYAHNARLLVGVGDTVRTGDPLSTVGMTGSTTGPHLHYEVYVEGQPVDPLEHLE